MFFRVQLGENRPIGFHHQTCGQLEENQNRQSAMHPAMCRSWKGGVWSGKLAPFRVELLVRIIGESGDNLMAVFQNFGLQLPKKKLHSKLPWRHGEFLFFCIKVWRFFSLPLHLQGGLTHSLDELFMRPNCRGETPPPKQVVFRIKKSTPKMMTLEISSKVDPWVKSRIYPPPRMLARGK